MQQEFRQISNVRPDVFIVLDGQAGRNRAVSRGVDLGRTHAQLDSKLVERPGLAVPGDQFKQEQQVLWFKAQDSLSIRNSRIQNT